MGSAQSNPRHAPPQGRKTEAQTRSLLGIVKNKNDQPLAGARVLLENKKTLEVRSFLTQANGAYRFDSLSLNTDYEVFAMYAGRRSATRTLSSFDSRTDAYMNLKIDILPGSSPPVTPQPPKP
jgi:hypothetical protein